MMKRDNAAKPMIASVRLVDSGFSNVNYAGWSGDLLAWELDAKDMAAIAHAAGMTSTLLLTKESTRKNVLASVRAASGAGDLLFVSYSGHGGQITDVSGEEDDKLDETWSLYEGRADRRQGVFGVARIAAGVRVLVLSDSCHSSRGMSSRTYAPAGTCATRSICLGSRRRPDRFLGH